MKEEVTAYLADAKETSVEAAVGSVIRIGLYFYIETRRKNGMEGFFSIKYVPSHIPSCHVANVTTHTNTKYQGLATRLNFQQNKSDWSNWMSDTESFTFQVLSLYQMMHDHLGNVSSGMPGYHQNETITNSLLLFGNRLRNLINKNYNSTIWQKSWLKIPRHFALLQYVNTQKGFLFLGGFNQVLPSQVMALWLFCY